MSKKTRYFRLRNTKALTFFRRHSILIFLLLTITFLFSSFAIVNSVLSPATVSAKSQVTMPPLYSATVSSLMQSSQSIAVSPQFNVQAAYVYVAKRTDHFTESNPLQNQTGITTLNAESLYPTIIYLNFSEIPNAKIPSCDAVLEVYSMQLIANTGASENYTYVEGTNYNPSFTNLTELSSHVNDFPSAFDTPLRGSFIFNDTLSKIYIGGRAGSYGSYTSNPSSLGLWSNGQPNTISISVQRTGWILANGSNITTIVDSISPLVAYAQLETYGNSFLLNGIVPPTQMSQIDPYNPPVPST